jgi:tetratricopeptide (TPR) repeat protein
MRKTHFRWYVLSLLSAILAMLTKEFPISLPLIMLLTEIYWFADGKIKLSKRLAYLLPLFSTGLIIVILYFPLFSSSHSETINELTQIDNILPDWSPGKIERSDFLYTQIDVIWSIYLKLILFPQHQSFHHECTIRSSLADVLPPLIGIMLMVCLAVGIARKYPLISFGIWWFFLTILPTSSIIPSTQLVAEQRLYLPLISLAFIGWEVWRYLLARKRLVVWMIGYAAMIAVLTVNRIHTWKDAKTLWNDVIHKYPASARAYFALGEIHFNNHDYDRAVDSFSNCLQLQQNYSWGYLYLGKSYQKLGRVQDAINQFNKAISINPNNLINYSNLIEIYRQIGKQEPQLVLYQKLIGLQPLNTSVWHQLGNTYMALNRWVEAGEIYQKILHSDPTYRSVYAGLGDFYRHQNDIIEAEKFYRRALISADIQEAGVIKNKLGLMFYESGQLPQARQELEEALNYLPGSATTHKNLAAVFMKMGDIQKAGYHAHQAVLLGGETSAVKIY